MTDQPSKVVPVNFYSLACECQDWASSAWLANQPTTEPDDEMKADLQKFVDRLYGLFLNLSGEGAAAPHEEAQTPAPQGGGEALGRNLYEAFWRRNGGNEPAWFDQSNAIRKMWDAIAEDALAARPSQSDEGEKT